MSFLLDADVLCELLRARPDATVLAWFASQPANGLFVISQFDGQIAAIALSHRLGLATRNASDFEGCSLALTSPWDIDERAEGLR